MTRADELHKEPVGDNETGSEGLDYIEEGFDQLGVREKEVTHRREPEATSATTSAARTSTSRTTTFTCPPRPFLHTYVPATQPPLPVAPLITHVHTTPSHHAPMLSKKPTPENMRDFEQSATLYFVLNKISADQQTAHVAYNITDPTIRDYYFADINAVHTLSFKRFMEIARTKLFGQLWHKKWRCEVMSMKQGSLPFTEWVDKCKSKNAILRGTISHLSEDEMRKHFNNNCHADLAKSMDANNCDVIVLFDHWMHALQILDEECRVHRVRFERWARDHDQQKRRTNNNLSSTTTPPATSGTATAPKPTSAARATWIPKLVSEEREYLRTHDGCFKCRKAKVFHQADKCEDDRPVLASYKLYTSAMKAEVDKLRARNATKMTTAAVAVDSRTTVASVTEVPSAVLGDGTSSETSEYVDPFHSPHYFWDCVLDGPNTSAMSPLHVRALIDNGSSTVPIKASVADALGLRRRKLPQPISLSLALDDSASPAATHTLTEWVKLKPRSCDGLWESRRVNAIISPSLCADIIPGNPFLTCNHCIIDHMYRTCIAKNAQYDLFRPVSPTVPPNVLPAMTASVSVVEDLRTHSDLLAQVLDTQWTHKERLDRVWTALL